MATQQNIVLLSDGTGNAAARVWRSNVWRLLQALDLRDSRQVAMYDDGVGTSSFKPLALAGGIFGWGLKRNVLDLYQFLCRNYERDAAIYAFGFSRGAFTIRVLLGLVANQGLVPYTTEAALQHAAVRAYRAYRRNRFHSVLHLEGVFRALRDAVIAVWDKVRSRAPYASSAKIPAPPIRFVGLWDTVAAYGLPIEEMTRGVSQWLWPLELPNRKLGDTVQRACHALALDDERTTFHPVLWSERTEAPAPPDAAGKRWVKDERMSQVWFAGVHANVGGGYPDDSLAHVPLTWIMKEAELCGLRFKHAPGADPDAILNAASAADKDGRLYDSRHGLAGYYRYGPRHIWELCHHRASRREDDEVTIDVPKIHATALDRALNGAHAYAPIGLPATYAVVTRDGEIRDGKDNLFETTDQARMRARAQERIWDLVWWRRVAYFATLTASGYLALFPLIYQTAPAHEVSTRLRLIPQVVRLVEGLLPGFAGWWLDAFASNPARFLAGAVAVVACMMWGVGLGNRISGEMNALWRVILRQNRIPKDREPGGIVYRWRTSGVHRTLQFLVKRHVAPLVSVVLLLYLGAALVNHLAFGVFDAAGFYCRESGGALKSLEQKREETVTGFATSAMCWPTGIELVEGRRYRITIGVVENWLDNEYKSDVTGFEIGTLPNFRARATMFAFLPLRRTLNRSWFRPIARIGATGADEYPLDPDPRLAATIGPADAPPATATPATTATPVTADSERVLVTDIKARRDGELFLYVNDAVLGIWHGGVFYANNHGTATIKVRRIGFR